MTSIAAKRKLLVSEVMSADPVTMPSNSSIIEAARLMRDRNIGTVIVENDGLIAGIVTDRDVVTRCIAAGRDARDMTLGEVASRNPVCVRADQHATDAVQKMRSASVSRLPVVDHGRVVGIVSIGDLALKLEDRTLFAAVFAGQHPENEG